MFWQVNSLGYFCITVSGSRSDGDWVGVGGCGGNELVGVGGCGGNELVGVGGCGGNELVGVGGCVSIGGNELSW
jgi:hypothetical protein